MPSIRDAVVADDDRMLAVAAGNMFATAEELRGRCAPAGSRSSARSERLSRAELCLSRLVHAIRLRVCLALIERAEARRRQPYELVRRARCALRGSWTSPSS